MQATSISPWVVTPAALEPFACEAPPQRVPPALPYLQQQPRCNYDVALQVAIQPPPPPQQQQQQQQPPPCVVTRSNMRTLYWTLPQVGAGEQGQGVRCSRRTWKLQSSAAHVSRCPAWPDKMHRR